MVAIMDATFRKNILQGEILALLHDIGKLHRLFVSSATGEKKKGVNPTIAHTLCFLAGTTEEFVAEQGEKLEDACIGRLQQAGNLPPLQKLLLQKISWLQLPTADMACLGSILGLHHYLGYKKKKDFLAEFKEKDYPEAMVLAMYADTSDSMFSKGQDNPSGKKDENRQMQALHLARPQGGMQAAIDGDSLERDSTALADALVAWADGNPASWEDAEVLLRKRNTLRALLHDFGSRHMAETRLPNNDVSLWQHTWAVAGLFKALLASYLLRGTWDGLLCNRGLVHTQQHLSLLAVQWDEDAYVARSTRPFEILGRKMRLHKLAEAIKQLVEDKLCLGNEMYRDGKGICFLVPELHVDDNGLAQLALDSLKEEITAFCNGEILDGDVQWQILVQQSGLRMTDMLEFWNHPEKAEQIHVQLAKPAWQEKWQGASGQQVCARCGLRPVGWSHSRTGGDGDTALCDTCASLRREGFAVMEALRTGKQGDALAFAHESFGSGFSFANINEFWNEKGEFAETADNRLALIQGIMPLDSIYDATFFDSLLTPPPDGKSWDALKNEIQPLWARISDGKEDEESRQRMTVLLADFSDSAEVKLPENGWCSTAEGNLYQKTWIHNVIFGSKEAVPADVDEQVRKILLWGLRQHPAPSRLGSMWRQVRQFMRSVFARASQLGIEFVPLTCDAGSFQILVRSRRAMELLRAIEKDYTACFGQVRHLLPLHLSAGVFYHKAPLYIAMDAARRFRRLADMDAQQWTLVGKKENEGSMCLEWQTPDGHAVVWNVPATLPDGRKDPYHTWFTVEGVWHPVSLFDLQTGNVCRVRPSTFDFEVLDASTRRYDIRYGATMRRPHFMMPRAASGPRPYHLEDLPRWQQYEGLFAGSQAKSQLKTALELVARLHQDWNADEEAFRPMIQDILAATLGGNDARALQPMAMDGSFFDLFEWFDFIGK